MTQDKETRPAPPTDAQHMAKVCESCGKAAYRVQLNGNMGDAANREEQDSLEQLRSKATSASADTTSPATDAEREKALEDIGEMALVQHGQKKWLRGTLSYQSYETIRAALRQQPAAQVDTDIGKSGTCLLWKKGESS